MASVEVESSVVKLAQFVQEAATRARAASLAELRSILQQHIDQTVAHGLRCPSPRSQAGKPLFAVPGGVQGAGAGVSGAGGHETDRVR